LSHNNYNLREKKRKCHQQSDASFAGKTRGSRTGRFNISQGRYEVEREREKKKKCEGRLYVSGIGATTVSTTPL